MGRLPGSGVFALVTLRRALLRTTCIQVALQKHLGGNAVASALALLVRQTGVPQGGFGEHRGETLIPVDARQAAELRQPGAEYAGGPRACSFVAGRVHRQADDQGGNLLRLDQFLEETGVLLRSAARVGGEGRRDAALGVADRQADADGAVVHAQKPAPRPAHRYFSRFFFFSISTIWRMVFSSRRSATRIASPSWMIRRLSTPTVAISCSGSATTRQFLVAMPQCRPRTVLPSASCGCMRSRASQLPTSSQRKGA